MTTFTHTVFKSLKFNLINRNRKTRLDHTYDHNVHHGAKRP